MIIQTGMRTDIPAFYSEWFANRLKAGFVYTRNPYDRKKVTEYSLSPDVVDLIAFCTKNPAPMFEYFDLLQPYGQYWFVTVTPYGKDLEPNLPPKAKIIDDFKRLSSRVGIHRIGWRYDPIIINKTHTPEWHIEKFSAMTKALCGYTDTCVISFIDIYEKLKKRAPELRELTEDERRTIGKAFVEIASDYGMTIKPCAEGNDLARYGADCGGCMTVQTFERALSCKLIVPKTKSQRSACACTLGKDIGEYNTCGHMCRYCYANADNEKIISNMKNHNPLSPFLIGDLEPGDIIHKANQKSWYSGQLSLF